MEVRLCRLCFMIQIARIRDKELALKKVEFEVLHIGNADRR